MTNRGITINEAKVCSFGHVHFVDFTIRLDAGANYKRYRVDWLALWEYVNYEWVQLVAPDDGNSLVAELNAVLQQVSVEESLKMDAQSFWAYADGWYTGKQAEVKVWVE